MPLCTQKLTASLRNNMEKSEEEEGERERAINYDLPNPSGPSPIVITFQYVSLLYTESSGNLSISLASSTIEISSPIIDKDRNMSSDLENDIKIIVIILQ